MSNFSATLLKFPLVVVEKGLMLDKKANSARIKEKGKVKKYKCFPKTSSTCNRLFCQ